MPRIGSGSVFQLARSCLQAVEAAGAGPHVAGPQSSCLATAVPEASSRVQPPVAFQPHNPTCGCATCRPRHGMACGCPACSKHSATYGYAACNTHTPTCSCLSCRSMQLFNQPHSMQQTRSFACSAGLGRAPPQQVIIEYDPEDVDAYIEVADALEAAFPNIVVLGNEQQEGRKGSFEVTTSDGFQVFSKLKERQYPNTDDLVARITSRAALNPDVLGEGTTQEGRFCT